MFGAVRWRRFRGLTLLGAAFALLVAGAWAQSGTPCAYFAEQFSPLSPYSWTAGNGHWFTQSEILHVDTIPQGKLAYVQTAFKPPGPFVVDVDVQVLSAGTGTAVGIYPFTNTGPFFTVGTSTLDGLGVLLYTEESKAQLLGWEVNQGTWQTTAPLTVTGPIWSVGLAYSASGVTLRINGRNADLSVAGSFTNALAALDTLWLMAQGAQTHAMFDDVCADPLQFTLTVQKAGAGAGRVTSAPGGIDCGADCSELYVKGTPVTLTAAPAAGSAFAGWSGACTGTGNCETTVDSNQTATATFNLIPVDNPPTVSITAPANGSTVSGTVTIQASAADDKGVSKVEFYVDNVKMGEDTSAPYQYSWNTATYTNAAHTLKATAYDTIAQTAESAVTVTVNNVVRWTLTVTKSGSGSGTVTSVPPGIDCGADCSETYDQNTLVTLSAAPAAGSTFVGWSGGGCSGTSPCAVRLTANLSVNAEFGLSGGQTPSGAQPLVLYFPFYQADASTFTGFAVSNYSEFDAQLEFRAYQTNGQAAYSPRQFALAPHRQLALLGHEIFQVPGSSVQSAWIELTSDNPEIGSFFQFGATTQMDGSTPFTEAAVRLVFTRIFHGPAAYRGQTAETWLSVANPGAEAVEVRLELKSDAGAVLASRTRTLAAKGFFYESVEQLFGTTGSVTGGYVDALVTQGAGVIGFELVKVPSRPTVIGLSGQPPGSATQLFSAQLATLPGFFTNLKLVNTASVARQVTLTAVSESGQSLAAPVAVQLAAGQTLERDASAVFGFSPAQVTVGSLRVEADGPGVLGDVVFGDDVAQTLAAALPLQIEKFTKAVFSQVVNQWGSFYTGVALYNPGSVETEAKIEVYRAEGALSGSCSVRLAAGQRIARLLTEWMPSTEGQVRGYVVVTSPQPLIAQLMFGSPTLLSAVPPTKVTWRYLTSGGIGAKGGTISAQGFSLTVPEGAWSETAAIRVSVSDEPGDFGEDTASRRYLVEGVPEDAAKPLSVSIPMTKAAVEETFLEVNVPVLSRLYPFEKQSSFLQPGTVQGDVFSSQIPLGPVEAGAASASQSAAAGVAAQTSAAGVKRATPAQWWAGAAGAYSVSVVSALRSLTEYQGNCRCVLTAPLGYGAASRTAMLGACTETLRLLRDTIGIPLPQNGEVAIYVVPTLVPDTRDAESEEPKFYNVKRDPWINVNRSRSNWASMRITLAHEIFHWLQYHYGSVGTAHFWLADASSAWIEQVVDPNQCPAVVDSPNAKFAMYGLFTPSTEMLTGEERGAGTRIDQEHGYGAASFLRWLAERHPDREKVIGRIWKDIKANKRASNPTGWDAAFTAAWNVNRSGDQTWTQSWLEFVHEYLPGVWSPRCPSPPNRRRVKPWTIDLRQPLSEKEQVLNPSLPPLSGDMIQVDIASFDNNLPVGDWVLTLKVDGLADNEEVVIVQVYKNAPTELGRLTKEKYSVGFFLKDFGAGHTYISAVLGNPHPSAARPGRKITARLTARPVWLMVGLGLQLGWEGGACCDPGLGALVYYLWFAPNLLEWSGRSFSAEGNLAALRVALSGSMSAEGQPRALESLYYEASGTGTTEVQVSADKKITCNYTVRIRWRIRDIPFDSEPADQPVIVYKKAGNNLVANSDVVVYEFQRTTEGPGYACNCTYRYEDKNPGSVTVSFSKLPPQEEDE